jgi:hypothetical protein
MSYSKIKLVENKKKIYNLLIVNFFGLSAQQISDKLNILIDEVYHALFMFDKYLYMYNCKDCGVVYSIRA